MAGIIRNFAERQLLSLGGEDFKSSGIKSPDDHTDVILAKNRSEWVKDMDVDLDTALEKGIDLFDPTEMVFLPDGHTGYTFPKPNRENAMRCNPATSDKASISSRVTYNHADFQVTPT